MKWEDKLLGRKFIIVTDHKGLEYFETQPSLSSRQTRWWEYRSHVDGDMNRVADCLSRYYENDSPDDHHLDHDFMSADAKLDPDGELIPVKRYAEMRTTATRWSTRLAEKTEQQVLDSDQMNNQVDDAVTDPDSDDDPPAFTSGADGQSLRISVERDVNLAWLVQAHYHKDPLFMKVLHHPEAHPRIGSSGLKPDEQRRSLHPLEGIHPGEVADRGHTQSSPYYNWPFRSIVYLSLCAKVLLVAFHGSRHRAFLQLVRPVPDHERLDTEACRATALPTDTQPTLAVGRARLHGSTAQIERSRLFISRNR